MKLLTGTLGLAASAVRVPLIVARTVTDAKIAVGVETMTDNPLSNPDSTGQTDWIEDLSSKEMTWDYCPSCTGELDTGFECNQCGRDWRPWATAFVGVSEVLVEPDLEGYPPFWEG